MVNALDMLHPALKNIMRKLGYNYLLPIQEKAIPTILSGYNTLVIAPTGSGKTEAAIFPIVSRMLSEETLCPGVKAVYITPLRALNRDVETRIKKILELSNLRVMVRHGDTTQSGRRIFSRSPPDLVITTPESLGLMLSSKNAERIWGCVKWVIVDEIHELLDSERGSELALILERLELLSRKKLQRIALSATISEKTEHEAKKLLAGSRLVSVVRDPSPKEYDISVIVVDKDESESFWIKASDIIAELAEKIDGKILVFVNTRATAEKLGESLAKRIGDDHVAVHHGSLSYRVRTSAEASFRSGDLKLLVSTSSMELGIDIGSVSLVVQFLSPRSVTAMAQRAGRAGHRFGEVSKAIIVTVNNIFEILESLIISYRVMHGKLEDLHIHTNALDALAHQIAGLLIKYKKINLNNIYELATRTGPYSILDYSLLEDLAEHLESVRIARIENDLETLRIGSRTYKYFYKISMIPDEKNYIVYDIITGSKIGELSERFVESQMSESGRRSFYFILAGKIWEAIDIDIESYKINAKPIAESSGIVPKWEGELIPVDYRIAREACSIISLCIVDEDACKRILEKKNANKKEINRIIHIIRDTKSKWGREVWLSESTPVIEYNKDLGIVLFSCLGSKGNFALATLISKLLERKNIHVEFDHIPYAIVFRALPGTILSARDVKESLLEARKIDQFERKIIILNSIKESFAYAFRFLHVAKRMGVVDPDSSLGGEKLKLLIRHYSGSLVDIETQREMIFDKIDFNALNNFLDNINNIIITSPHEPSMLLLEVFSNPYLRRDKTLNIKKIALDTIINSFKLKLKKKNAILLCTNCGYTWKTTVEQILRETHCPRCGSRMIAILPDTEWGKETAKIGSNIIKIGKKPRGKRAKLIKELRERAFLYIEYYRDGLSDKVVEALLAPGVGPTSARRAINAYLEHGEKAFYKELFKIMENYTRNKKYWSTNTSRKTSTTNRS